MPGDFPEHGRGHAADQRMAHAQPPGRHHEVHRRQNEDLAGEPEQIQQHARKAMQGPEAAEQVDTLLPHRLQAAGHQRDEQQADAEREDVAIRDQRRKDEAALSGDDAMQEDHRHRVLEHGEGEGAEEDHGAEQQPADVAAVVEKVRQLADDRH